MKSSIKNLIHILSFLLVASAAWTGTHAVAQDDDDSEEILEKLVFRGTKLEGVLQMLEMRTGRAVIRPQALPTPEFTFDSQVPLNNEEVILAIESLLSLNGIGVTPLGEKFLKVVPIDTIRTEAPELVIGPLKDRYPSNKVVSKLFRLKYLDSQTFQQQIQPFLSPRFSTIIPFQNSNAVIVTDTVSNLQRLEYVVSEVDLPSRLNIDTRFYTLNYAQASEVADHIQSLIDAARSSFGNSGKSGNNSNAKTPTLPIEGAASGVNSSGDGGIPMQILFGSNTALSSDDRTNQIIIMTEPSNLQFFDDIIAKLDIKADPSTRIEVIPLKHADAVEVASLLTDVVSGKTGNEREDRSTANSNESNQRSGPFNNTRNQPSAPQATRTSTAASSGSGGEDADSQFSDFMTIIADERSNSLVISGTRGDLEIIRVLVNQIDVLLAQVQIEVVLVDVTLSNEQSRGIDALGFTYKQGVDGEKDSVTIAGEDEIGANLLGLSLGGTSFSIEDGNISDLVLSAIFQKAATDTNVSVLSVPTVVTTHNREATVVVGQAVPIISSSQSSLTDSDVTRDSYQFEDIALELKVKPLIGPNNVIQLEIEQTFDEEVGETTINGNIQPIIGRREASSFVSVADGELVVLGGLQRESTSDTKIKTAILGDIPFIGGWLFGKKSKSKTRTELMVFIRPTIMRTTSDVNDHSNKMMNSLSDSVKLKEYLNSSPKIQEVDSTEEEVEPAKKKGLFGRSKSKDSSTN